jgi:hypothetical protein
MDRAGDHLPEVPLDWCLSTRVGLDFRHWPTAIVSWEVEDELSRISHVLKPLDIVLVNTAAGAAMVS